MAIGDLICELGFEGFSCLRITKGADLLNLHGPLLVIVWLKIWSSNIGVSYFSTYLIIQTLFSVFNKNFIYLAKKTNTLKMVALVSAVMTSCRLQKWKIKEKETKVTQNTGDNGGFCSATLRWFHLVVLSRIPRDFILSQALYCGEFWYSFSASA